jgi:hypothetical protein
MSLDIPSRGYLITTNNAVRLLRCPDEMPILLSSVAHVHSLCAHTSLSAHRSLEMRTIKTSSRLSPYHKPRILFLFNHASISFSSLYNFENLLHIARKSGWDFRKASSVLRGVFSRKVAALVRTEGT